MTKSELQEEVQILKNKAISFLTLDMDELTGDENEQDDLQEKIYSVTDSMNDLINAL